MAGPGARAVPDSITASSCSMSPKRSSIWTRAAAGISRTSRHPIRSCSLPSAVKSSSTLRVAIGKPSPPPSHKSGRRESQNPVHVYSEQGPSSCSAAIERLSWGNTTMSSIRRMESRLEKKLPDAPPRPNLQRRRSNNAAICGLAQGCASVFLCVQNVQKRTPTRLQH
jgi:hypothetical protein